MNHSADDPHRTQPVLHGGSDLSAAEAGMILLHGRGASAQGMLDLASGFDVEGLAYRAPQAALRTWYPESFLVAREKNEPELSSALRKVNAVLDEMASDGVPPNRIILLGFSQGACLACEYAVRHPRRFGGVVGLSGGLIGPDEAEFQYEGSLAETPVFLGCSDDDPYIPEERVHTTAETLRAMEAEVTVRIYEGLGHTTNDDELRRAEDVLERVLRGGDA